MNQAWCEMLKNREVHVLVARTFDHKPVMVRSLDTTETKSRFHRSFKFKSSLAS